MKLGRSLVSIRSSCPNIMLPEFDKIVLRKSETLDGLTNAEEKTVWEKHDEGEMSWHIWAPELHYVMDGWYIYFAASRADDI